MNITILGFRINNTESGWTGYLLNMTSQKWRNEEEVNYSVWTHQLLIIRPEEIDFNDLAAVYITGGYNENPRVPSTKDIDVIAASIIALSSRVTTAVLFQIPNQAIVFNKDPELKHRAEDDAVSWTWKEFIEDPSRPDRVLYLPMVKAAVRALDTVTAYSQALASRGQWSHVIERFYIAGASKRGATTWLTAAVEGMKSEKDRRVIGAALYSIHSTSLTPCLECSSCTTAGHSRSVPIITTALPSTSTLLICGTSLLWSIPLCLTTWKV